LAEKKHRLKPVATESECRDFVAQNRATDHPRPGSLLRPGKAGSDLLGAIWSRTYSTLWYPALPFALFAAGRGAQNRRQRLGGAPAEADMRSDGKLRVWLHAASVGEIEGVRPVVQHLGQIRPDLALVITTMTQTGRDAARRRLNGICQLAPFDHAAAVRSFIARIRPALVMITETELWPNFFLESAAVGAGIALINARLSMRSMSRYRFIRPLIARALKSANLVLAQTAADAERFCQLGAMAERVAVTGNAKYEVVGNSAPLRPALASFAGGRPILVAGSTGPGEEQIVLNSYRNLAERFPSLALVLAPRHLHRIDEVERILHAAGLSYARASESNSPTAAPAIAVEEAAVPHETVGYPHVLLLDTMGELGALYQRATIAFVGGSLMPGRGGQSLAEPANASVPVLFGPYYENHRQLGDALIAADSGRVVHDAKAIVDASAKWLADEASRVAAGQRARSVMEQLGGSTSTIVRYICGLLPAS
jgi:3-deoxy-D-manno-octulosonic-acid transferase